jgi:tartrate dehydratase alpha subunit/fumarate hydratase class I-like protein
MRVREITAAEIAGKVAELCIQACTVLPPDVAAALEAAREREESALGREVLARLLENARLAAAEGIPMCQDTGLAVVFVEVGEGLRVTDATLRSAYSAEAAGAASAAKAGSEVPSLRSTSAAVIYATRSEGPRSQRIATRLIP